ncbi:MAG: hypothetical protein ACKO72_04980 [Actinomycetes bacterium]
MPRDTWMVTPSALERLGRTEEFRRFAARWNERAPRDPLSPARVYGGLADGFEWPTAEAMTSALCANHGGGVPREVIDAFVACCDPAHGD